MDQNQRYEENEDTNSKSANKTTSLGSLIAWNISKALEKSPHIDLKCAIKAAQARLDRDVNVVFSQCPEERYLECAFLAWQQLGHSDAHSLYRFYETKKIEQEQKGTMHANKIYDYLEILDTDTKYSKANGSAGYSSYSMGPVVKLPVQSKVIMRMENSGNTRQTHNKPKADQQNIMNKIDAVCCLDSECMEQLSKLDATTSELRLRAAKLAQREAERAELLERAEAAWKDLELGYHRRLTLAEEKEDDISKQIQKLLEERTSYKTICMTLAQQLKEQGEAAEKARTNLTELEKSVYDRACVRHRLNEQIAKEEAALAEQHCKGAQVDRDLQFKEEEARRKLRNMESDMESIRALTHDTERAMRAELGALKEQVARISQQLLNEDAETGHIKKELEELQQEKMGIVDDLEGCKVMCENRMLGRMDELKKKKQQLNELNDKIIECHCKFPTDAMVEVKRTGSLAALCHCTPEEKMMESCSCTSLRSQLVSNLLSDLFGGLLTELRWTGVQMPCQLLKCLEDKHNWDRTSDLKTNLRSFFARSLTGELDIAIATSIEKYHAKWVGATCADAARIRPDTSEAENVGWQERAIELRAQKLATKLAEQLYQDRADEIAQRAKDTIKSDPPPCECGPRSAVYPCIVKTPQPTLKDGDSRSGEESSPQWRRALSDVTQLRLQVENLKKESIKKADMNIVEKKIAKLAERTTVQECLNAVTPDADDDIVKSLMPLNEDSSTSKKKSPFLNNLKKGNNKISNMKYQMPTSAKSFNKLKRTFAVNLCLCGTQTSAKKKAQRDKRLEDISLVPNDHKYCFKQKVPNAPIPGIKKMKPTQLSNTEINYQKQSKTTMRAICEKNCLCFNKKPSNTSIDKLLEMIANWKNDLPDSSATQDKKSKENYDKIMQSSINSTKKENSVIYSIKGMENSIIVSEKGMENSIMPSKKSIENSIKYPKKSMENKRYSKSSYTCDQSEIMKKKPSTKDQRQEHTNGLEILQAIPKTDSEYMGPVSLDKSNESLCQCDDNDNKNNDACEIPHKRVSHKNCDCSTLFAKTTILSEQSLQTEPTISGKEVSGSKIKIKQYPIPIKSDDHNQTENDFKIDASFKSHDDCLCDCDITLLGVTLTNKKFKKRKSSRITRGRYSNEDYETGNGCGLINDFNNNTVGKSGSSGRCSKKSNLGNFAVQCDEPTCSCQGNFDDLKSFVTNVTNDPKKNFMLKIDKEIDLIEIPQESPKVESCVCCNINNIAETENLEENTFHLLEEHLKEKLDEFKSTLCKSSCIPQEEETHIFSTLVQKVKQTILDTANDVSCRCSSKPPTEGSWNRVHILLQEYLKAKINRVECQCKSKEEPSAVETVLNKVCKLIEQDFDRLKSICNCQKSKKTHTSNFVKPSLYEEEIPVKDVNQPQAGYYLGDENVQNTYKSKKVPEFHQHSPKSYIITENISSQVPLNLGMESKSCNAVEKDSVNIQTSDVAKKSAHNECGLISSKSYYDCSCDVMCKDYDPVFGLKRTELKCTKLEQECDANKFPKNSLNLKSYSYPRIDKQRITSTAIENIKNEKTNNDTNTCEKDINVSKTTHLPYYVGYTVDCSCDRSIGTCVCMKSVVQENKNIVDVWKTYFDYNKKPSINVSYIMNSAACKPPVIMKQISEKIPRVSKSDKEYRPKHEICDVKLSANLAEDITLKKSLNSIGSVRSAACSLTSSLNKEPNCCTSKDSFDWCECSSRPVNVSNTDEYDKLICSDESSDVFKGDLGDNKLKNQLPKNCYCDVVPICHVKMLIESIENKIVQSRCTCDSLAPNVCPIHSLGLF